MAFDLTGIDDVIHGRLRLGVMAYLAGSETADFNELKTALQATQGNLSVHLRKLEDAGYITIEKAYRGRKPHTAITLTATGRSAFAKYLAAMEALIKETPSG